MRDIFWTGFRGVRKVQSHWAGVPLSARCLTPSSSPARLLGHYILILLTGAQPWLEVTMENLQLEPSPPQVLVPHRMRRRRQRWHPGWNGDTKEGGRSKTRQNGCHTARGGGQQMPHSHRAPPTSPGHIGIRYWISKTRVKGWS